MQSLILIIKIKQKGNPRDTLKHKNLETGTQNKATFKQRPTNNNWRTEVEIHRQTS